MNQCHHLLKLAESWRSKAAHLQAKYGKTSPVATQHCVVALETCAEELEAELHRAPVPEPANRKS